jgi:putative hydrolase of the HAD superfamily
MEALIFDLDDTLVVDEASATAAFLDACQVAQQATGISPDELYATIKKVCREIWHKSPARAYCVQIGISSWEGLWAEFEGADRNQRLLHAWAPIYRKSSWHEALQQHGVDNEALASELVEAYISSRRKRHVIYDDVAPCLAEFKGRYRLGLLTNGDPGLQRRKIAGAGIGGYFGAIVISGEEGIGKPDARIFAIALSRLGVASDAAVMIGNSLKSDIQGAQAAGMKAVWINRSGKSGDEFVTPDFVASNLLELREALHRNQIRAGGRD